MPICNRCPGLTFSAIPTQQLFYLWRGFAIRTEINTIALMQAGSSLCWFVLVMQFMGQI